jgi:hypothetical protein
VRKIFGGILSFAIGKINGPLSTWKVWKLFLRATRLMLIRYQYIFLIYGAVTMFAGILVCFALPNDPGHAWFFTKEEKDLARMRVSENRAATRDKVSTAREKYCSNTC